MAYLPDVGDEQRVLIGVADCGLKRKTPKGTVVGEQRNGVLL